MTFRSLAGRWAILATAVLLSACSANHKAIYRHQAVTDGATITTTDAKQRAILSLKNGTSSRFCAEPSPDVFAVIAQSLSVGGTFGQQADPKAIQAALNAAFSSSEQASTIPRTQTINMLRELMYRTCERYLNGSIGELELPLQAIRDQRLMVSILAIEQLTGAVASKAVALGAVAAANAGASASGAMTTLDKARTELKTKADALAKAQTAFELKVMAKVDGAEKEFEACTALAGAKTDTDKKALPKEVQDKEADCAKLKAAVDQADAEHKEAKAHHEQLSKLASAGSIPVATSTDLMTPTAVGGLDKAGGGTLGDVAGVVKDIVQMNFKQDEFLMLCLKRLSHVDGKSGQQDDVTKECISYVTQKIDEERSASQLAKAETDLRRQRLSVETKRLQGEGDRQFDAFWKAISTGDGQTIAPARLQAVQQKSASLQRCRPPISASSTKAEALICFQGLTASQKQALASTTAPPQE